MNTEQEKLRASIEALEQMLGLTGKQNDTDANWARYLLSITNKQKHSGKSSKTNHFSAQLLSIRKENNLTFFQGPEKRTGSGRREHYSQRLASHSYSRNSCRRVNRDRRKLNISKKFMGLS